MTGNDVVSNGFCKSSLVVKLVSFSSSFHFSHSSFEKELFELRELHSL